MNILNVLPSLKTGTLRLLLLVCTLTIVVGQSADSTQSHRAKQHSSTATVIADSTNPAAEKKKKAKEKTVYVTNTGSKYHAAGCRYLRKSSIPMTLSEAKKSYSPCSVCSP